MILTCPNCATRFYVETDVFGATERKVRCSRCRHVWVQEPLAEDWEPPAPPSVAPQPAGAAKAAKPEARASQAESWPEAPPPPPPPKPGTIPEPPVPNMGPPHISGFDDEDDLLQADRPPLHPPLDEPPLSAEEEDPDAVLARRRERLAQAGVQRPAGKPPKERSLAWIGWLLLIALLGALIGGGYQKRAEIIAFYPPVAKLYEQLGIPVEAADWLGLELHNLKSSIVLDEGQTKIAVSGEVANVGDAERRLPAIRISMRGADGKELAAYTVPLEQPSLAAQDKLAFDFKLPAPKEDVTDLEVAFATQTAR